MSDIRYYTDGEQATASVLNRPLQDLEKQSQYMSEAQFESLRENRKNQFAGSGIIKGDTEAWGGDWGGINADIFGGLFTLNSFPSISNFKYKNTIATDWTPQYGHKKRLADFNVDGILIKYAGIKPEGTNYIGGIQLPEAPTAILENNIISSSNNYNYGDFMLLNDITYNHIGNADFENSIDSWYAYSDEILDFEDNKLKVQKAEGNTGRTHSCTNFNLIKNVIYEMKFNIESFGSSTRDVALWIRTSSNSSTNLENMRPITDDGLTVTFRFRATKSGYMRCIITDNYSSYNDSQTGDYYLLDNVSIKQEKTEIIVCNKPINLEDNIDEKSSILEAVSSVSRKDLIFLETWHELISEKDFVYPYGNVQFYSSTVEGLPSTVEGSFEGSNQYSLLGEWQEPGDIIGSGYKWSELSESEKLIFASNTDNNIYLSNNGLVQVRFRTRVIKGMGDYFDNPAPNYNSQSGGGNWLRFNSNGNGKINPRGKITSFTDSNEDDISQYVGIGHSHIAKSCPKGNFVIGNQDPYTYGYNLDTYVTPIALVQRRNKGAYHIIHNPEGCALFGDGYKWNETSSSNSSIIDCFSNFKDGNVTSELTGRYDSLYYDGIVNKDIEDLRISAKKIENIEKYMIDKMNRVIKGIERGKEELNNSQIRITKSDSNNINNSIILSGTNINNNKAIWYDITNDRYLYTNQNGYYYDSFDNTGAIVISKNIKLMYIMGLTADPYNMQKPGRCDRFKKEKYTSNTRVTVCDIIGDPKFYPTEWYDKMPGQPQLYKEDGSSLLPKDIYSGTSITIKMSRKMVGFSRVHVKKADGTWFNAGGSTVPVSANHSSLLNERYYNISDYEELGYNSLEEAMEKIIILHYYESMPYTLDPTSNKEVIFMGPAYSNNYYGYYINGNLINKVPLTSTKHSDQTELISKMIWTDGKSINSSNLGHDIEHNPLKLGNFACAAKFVPAITDTFGIAHLNIFYKELLNINNYDAIGEVIVINVGDTVPNLSEGELIEFRGLNNEINGVTLRSVTDYTGEWTLEETSFGNSNFIDNGELLDMNTGSVWFRKWDSSSYGDDNSIQVIDGCSGMRDDSGGVIAFGQKKIKLTNFI